MSTQTSERRAGASTDGAPALEPAEEARYLPIERYALVGDTRGSALVGHDGRVDWCALERMDADPACCRLLDFDQGGFLSCRPRAPFRAERGYLPGTAVLRTVLSTASGALELIDFMPVGRAPGASVHDYVSLAAPHLFVRIVRGLWGRVPLPVRCKLTEDHGARVAAWARPGTDLPLTRDAQGTWRADVELTAGAEHVIAIGGRAALFDGPGGRAAARRLLSITRSFWDEWGAYCRYEGPYRAAALRSAIALKLLTDSRTGAVVAAPTTSLPEWLGGEKNWDYRYCWLRDASLTLYALDALGFTGEARAFTGFLRSVCETPPERIQVFYRVDGGHIPGPRELDHLEGYAGSRPVRLGNKAAGQPQLDLFGDILECAWFDHRLGVPLDEAFRRGLTRIADYVAWTWELPGFGMWEERHPPSHFVQGKVKSWLALDRAHDLLGPKQRWAEAKRAIVRSIEAHGIDLRAGTLRRAYDDPSSDGDLLLVPFSGIPLPRELFRRTIERAARELRATDDLIFRRRPGGHGGPEGAFVACSFWLVSALLAQGRPDEARERFERLLARANDVGLYAEEIEPESGRFLGNFPQGFSHVGLVLAATDLQLYERHGPAGVEGSLAERAQRAGVGSWSGHGLGATLSRAWSTGRVRSSRASILDVDRLGRGLG